MTGLADRRTVSGEWAERDHRRFRRSRAGRNSKSGRNHGGGRCGDGEIVFRPRPGQPVRWRQSARRRQVVVALDPASGRTSPMLRHVMVMMMVQVDKLFRAARPGKVDSAHAAAVLLSEGANDGVDRLAVAL